jgi:hypothetical protein
MKNEFEYIGGIIHSKSGLSVNRSLGSPSQNDGYEGENKKAPCIIYARGLKDNKI